MRPGPRAEKKRRRALLLAVLGGSAARPADLSLEVVMPASGSHSGALSRGVKRFSPAEAPSESPAPPIPHPSIMYTPGWYSRVMAHTIKDKQKVTVRIRRI